MTEKTEDILEAIEKVRQTMMKEVEVYFKTLEEHNCLNRIDTREQIIMKMMPLVFEKKLKKELNLK